MMVTRLSHFIVVGLVMSACGTSSIPEGMRGVFDAQQSGGNRFLPVITLNGDSIVNLEVFSAYQEAGALAQSIRDGVIPSSQISISSNVNNQVLGKYSVLYRVTDSTGRSSSLSREVNVVDTTIPVITITQDSTVTFEKLGYGNSNSIPYMPSTAGVVATDNYDTQIQSKIQYDVLDSNGQEVSDDISTAEGNYFVTYNVQDQSGNPALPKLRTVQVRTPRGRGFPSVCRAQL